MKSRIVFVALASALIGAATTASLQSIAQHEGHEAQEHGHGYKGGSLKLHEITHRDAEKMAAMKLSNNTDTDFAMLMADHHAMAIKMADIEIKYGKVAALKAMAKKMKAAQSKERQQLLKHAKMHHH